MNPFDQGYFDEHELADAGFAQLGKNVKIAKNCTIVGLENISIADNVRIDSYCSIVANEGSISIGGNVHIAGYCLLAGSSGIELSDFCGLSHGVRIYSQTDDYSGKFLTNPTVPSQYLGITKGAVKLERHVIIGSGTVVLPGAELGEGAAIGAMSLVTKSLTGWGVYFGCPAKRIKSRSQNLLQLERELITRRRT